MTATRGPKLLHASARAAPLPDTWEVGGGIWPAPESTPGGWPGDTAGAAAPARAPLRVLPVEHLERRARRRRTRLTLTVAASLVAVSLPVVPAVILVALALYGPMAWFCRYASRRWGTGNVRADLVRSSALDLRATFHINAELRVDPAPPVAFETVVELTTGYVAVRESTG